MDLKVIIDPNSGACPGVRRAIRIVEQQLSSNGSMVALGPVIHNEVELDRLQRLGLHIEDHAIVHNEAHLRKILSEKIFIRTHGISLAEQERLKQAGLKIIDGTCPTVHRVQEYILSHYQDDYQIVIIGKPDHPEVIGLMGHCDNKGIVITDENDFTNIDFSRKTLLLSQTTASESIVLYLLEKLRSRIKDLVVIDTICKQIKYRQHDVKAFASSVDIVLMVGGKESSNTGVLYNYCKQANPRCYRIESIHDIRKEWIKQDDRIGVTGSASTPAWQLLKVKDYLAEFALQGLSK